MNLFYNHSLNKKPRIITIGQNYSKYDSNIIETSKYTLLTFIPLNLIEQFSKLSNVYFLILIILQCIKKISTSNGIPTILPSLMIIISISAFKDFLEDYKRWKSDKAENNRKTFRYQFLKKGIPIL
jgi:phospholipid-transporting ATPase